jgi:hypothetical protein
MSYETLFEAYRAGTCTQPVHFESVYVYVYNVEPSDNVVSLPSTLRLCKQSITLATAYNWEWTSLICVASAITRLNTPRFFFFGGMWRVVVYATPVDIREELIVRIHAAFEQIQHRPLVFDTVWQSLLWRCNECHQVRGRRFEDLVFTVRKGIWRNKWIIHFITVNVTYDLPSFRCRLAHKRRVREHRLPEKKILPARSISPQSLSQRSWFTLYMIYIS